MKFRTLYLLGFILAALLACILVFNFISGLYIRSLESPYVDPLLGRWLITWDANTAGEQEATIRLDRIDLRQWHVFVSRDGTVKFIDEEGCEHFGELSPSGDRAEGFYSGCRIYPDWVGKWEMSRLEP